MADDRVLWEACGYTPTIAIKIPFWKYKLTESNIQAETGLFFKNKRSIPLYRIATKEIRTNGIGRLFNVGSVYLTTRGPDVPDACLLVKDPENVLKMIEDAQNAERSRFTQKKKNNNYGNNYRRNHNYSNGNNYSGKNYRKNDKKKSPSNGQNGR